MRQPSLRRRAGHLPGVLVAATTGSLEEKTPCSSRSPVSGLAKYDSTATAPALPATRSGRIAILLSCGPPGGTNEWTAPLEPTS